MALHLLGELSQFSGPKQKLIFFVHRECLFVFSEQIP